MNWNSWLKQWLKWIETVIYKNEKYTHTKTPNQTKTTEYPRTATVKKPQTTNKTQTNPFKSSVTSLTQHQFQGAANELLNWTVALKIDFFFLSGENDTSWMIWNKCDSHWLWKHCEGIRKILSDSYNSTSITWLKVNVKMFIISSLCSCQATFIFI